MSPLVLMVRKSPKDKDDKRKFRAGFTLDDATLWEGAEKLVRLDDLEEHPKSNNFLSRKDFTHDV